MLRAWRDARQRAGNRYPAASAACANCSRSSYSCANGRSPVLNVVEKSDFHAQSPCLRRTDHVGRVSLPCHHRRHTPHLRRHACRTRHQSRTARQNLQEDAGGRRHFIFHCARLDHRAAGRQRGRQDHHDRHDDGLDAHLRPVTVLGAEMPRQRYRVLPPDEFREPLCRHADAAYHPAEPHGVRHALRRPRCRRRIAELAEALDLDRPA